MREPIKMQQSSTKKAEGGGNPKQGPQHLETVIIGTGFSGLLAAIGLQRRNFNDFVLLERSVDIGGTWQANSYPGAEVDVPTGLYWQYHSHHQFRACGHQRPQSSVPSPGWPGWAEIYPPTSQVRVPHKQPPAHDFRWRMSPHPRCLTAAH